MSGQKIKKNIFNFSVYYIQLIAVIVTDRSSFFFLFLNIQQQQKKKKKKKRQLTGHSNHLSWKKK